MKNWKKINQEYQLGVKGNGIIGLADDLSGGALASRGSLSFLDLRRVAVNWYLSLV